MATDIIGVPDYKISTNTKEFKDIEADRKSDLTANDKIFNDAAKDLTSAYDTQIQASKDYADKQTEIQNEQFKQTQTEINQQKAQLEKDYTKEQSAAYTDHQKQINPYGVQSEERAAMGLADSGYAESSKVAVYNQYQARVTAARESFMLAKQNYDNMMANARIQNSSALAKIAYEALAQQSALAIELVTKKSTLVLEQAREKRAINSLYDDKWNTTVNRLMQEKALGIQLGELELGQDRLEEEIRQFNKLHATNYSGTKVTVEKGRTSKSGKNGGNSKTANKVLAHDDNTKGKSTKPNLPNDSPKPNMQSIMDLGRGPINAKKLNSLITAGEVKEYVSGGELRYKNARLQLKD